MELRDLKVPGIPGITVDPHVSRFTCVLGIKGVCVIPEVPGILGDLRYLRDPLDTSGSEGS